MHIENIFFFNKNRLLFLKHINRIFIDTRKKNIFMMCLVKFHLKNELKFDTQIGKRLFRFIFGSLLISIYCISFFFVLFVWANVYSTHQLIWFYRKNCNSPFFFFVSNCLFRIKISTAMLNLLFDFTSLEWPFA